jgi:flavin reductase (DIM6/NTAB) family NADH-FMN oxidoreductase RutF
VLWSLSCAAPSLPAFRTATHFGVNVLTTEQQHLSVRFARPLPDKFEGVAFELGEYGVPMIEGAAAHFECRIVDRYYGGDHEIFLGHVERYSYERKPTLLFCHGAYCEARELSTDGSPPET